jgi:hypothetical protein
MTSAEKKHLAAYVETIDQQAEFGDVEAIDLLEGKKVAYHLYWWPMTDGILVDAATGAVAADLLDGSMAIDDDSLRARVEAGYREAGDDRSLPKSLTLHFR